MKNFVVHLVAVFVIAVVGAQESASCPNKEVNSGFVRQGGSTIQCGETTCPESYVNHYYYNCNTDPNSGTYCGPLYNTLSQETVWYTCEDDECKRWSDPTYDDIGMDTLVCP